MTSPGSTRSTARAHRCCACTASTTSATPGGSAGHSSPRALAWIPMRRLPRWREGADLRNVAGDEVWRLQGSSPTSTSPQAQRSEAGIHMEGSFPGYAGGRARTECAASVSLWLHCWSPLSDPRQALFPSSVFYKKTANKASILDEAIEYLKSLQMQLQIMWMTTGMAPMMFPGSHQFTPPTAVGA
ncbi:hypothetical protein VPH35_139758 [Triticum aestivum]|uniref:Uncharacterized protein n=1 Tax=Aegilops tauschii subsp. strangulata TaxID=200361 RepID=A0A453SZT4_AEGTS|nr:uncharacterized protein LOC123168083 isoform X1 [Triticum aestivum]